MRIFISYSGHDRAVADRINLGLRNEGYQVFFDRDNLSGGDEIHAEIRRQIKRSDLFVFLATRASLDSRSYTVNELDLARDRWPSPRGRVLTVNIDRIPIQDLPAYLAAVSIPEQQGDIVAAVLFEVAKMARRLRKQRLTVFGAPIVIIAGTGALLWFHLHPQQTAPTCRLQGMLSVKGGAAGASFDQLYLDVVHAGDTRSANVMIDGSVPAIDVGPLTHAEKSWTIALRGPQGLVDERTVEGCPATQIRVALGKHYELVLDPR